MNGPLAIMLVIGIFILKGPQYKTAHLIQWGQVTARYAGGFLPLMILLCLLMGICAVLTGVHKPTIDAFADKHPFLGPLIATFITPSTNVFLPVVQNSWTIAERQPMCLFYLIASAQVSVPLFMLRQMGFGTNSPIPIRMYITGFIVAVGILPLMRPICALVEIVCQRSNQLWAMLQ